MKSSAKKANASIPIQNIQIQDVFWNKYVKIVKEVIVTYQWQVLNDQLEDVETSHCIENFKIAAGESTGRFEGAVFQDTDVAKWLEAVGFVLSNERDEELEKLADETIELIGRAQCDDGYINTYYSIEEPDKRWSNLMEGHELYTAGHLIEAAVAYYEATGKKRFVSIVSQFADLICETFGNGKNQIKGYPGHQEIELALIKLYRITGTQKYLEMAKFFIDTRGVGENYFKVEENREYHQYIFPEFKNYDPKYSQSHLPVRAQLTAEGHAVRATYMYCAMADLAYEYDDQDLMNACDALWDNIVNKRMYITGSIGSSGLLERFTTDYDLPNDINYSETCASIGLALFGKRMAEIKKDASYMDAVETALYNTILAGIAMDGKSFFYVNPLEVWPEICLDHTSRAHVKPIRQKWFGVACCPPNIARTLASLGQYIYFKDEGTLYTNLYISNKTNVVLNGVPFEIKVRGDYPWDGQIRMEIETKEPTPAEFAFRIPAYVNSYEIFVNGIKLESVQVEKSYVKISGIFNHDVIEIKWDIPTVFMYANTEVRVNSGKAAVRKGPLIYCFEEVDNGKNLASIYVDTSQEIRAVYEKDLMGGTLVLELEGKRLKDDPEAQSRLYTNKKATFENIKLKAVPYAYWSNRMPGEMIVWLKALY